MPDDFPFSKIWSKLRQKAWFWLYRRDIVLVGQNLAKEMTLTKARATGPNELEVTAQSLHPAPYTQVASLLLRLTDQASVNIVGHCSCKDAPHCRHTAAILFYLSTESGAAQCEHRVKTSPSSPNEEEDASPFTLPPNPAHPPTIGQPQQGLPIPTPPRPIPTAPRVDTPSDDEIIPMLRLRRVECQRIRRNHLGEQPTGEVKSVVLAEPLIRYESCPQVFSMVNRTPIYRWQDATGQKRTLVRNTRAERLILMDLEQEGLDIFGFALPTLRAPNSSLDWLSVSEESHALFWPTFINYTVPDLIASGWEIDLAPDLGYQILLPKDDQWFTELNSTGSGIDWFKLDLGVEIDGQRISLVPILVRAIDNGLTTDYLESKQGESILIRLDQPGDPVLSVPATRLLELLRFLDELLSTTRNGRSKDTGPLQIDRLRAAQLKTLGGLPIVAPIELEKLRDRLNAFTELQLVEPPTGLQASLRPYQQEGLSWLQFLREFDLHGVLADDMGLGKTLQTLAHLLTEKNAGRTDRPSLIVATTSVLRNWVVEARKFTPQLKVLLLHGTDRRSDFKHIKKYDIVVTSYQLLVRDIESLQPIEWHILALDEAQNIKNHKAKASEAVRSLNARHRLCLTGTPMENHLGELWSLYHFLMPGYLGGPDSFRAVYRNPIEKKQDSERQRQLASRLQPLLLRRTKDAVASDLPPKTEIIHSIELGKNQLDLYETIRAAMDKRVREAISAQGLDRSHIIVLEALLKLRQACCHPALIKQESARNIKESAKTDFLLDDLIPELIEEGRRILLFSQFTGMLAIIEEKLIARKIEFLKLTGETNDRQGLVDRFQSGSVPIFLISLKAGGAGLNLTAADTVIHYDPWWNPAVEAQASDRAHRIGQTKPVFIHKLICAGTIEERIQELQQKKAAILEGLLTGRTDKLRLTQEDIQNLLAPAEE